MGWYLKMASSAFSPPPEMVKDILYLAKKYIESAKISRDITEIKNELKWLKLNLKIAKNGISTFYYDENFNRVKRDPEELAKNKLKYNKTKEEVDKLILELNDLNSIERDKIGLSIKTKIPLNLNGWKYENIIIPKSGVDCVNVEFSSKKNPSSYLAKYYVDENTIKLFLGSYLDDISKLETVIIHEMIHFISFQFVSVQQRNKNKNTIGMPRKKDRTFHDENAQHPLRDIEFQTNKSDMFFELDNTLSVLNSENELRNAFNEYLSSNYRLKLLSKEDNSGKYKTYVRDLNNVLLKHLERVKNSYFGRDMAL